MSPLTPSPLTDRSRLRAALLAHVRATVVDAFDGAVPDAAVLEETLGDDPDALLLALEACGHIEVQ